MNLEALTINSIRTLSIDAVEKAKSGHPGLPMGAAALGYTLWAKHMKHSSEKPDWFDRDRFVLSAGHGSMLLYSLLHLFGYPLPSEELKHFRQWNSKTPGHPEFGHTIGVDATTGPLGQGIANAVGMAIAEAHLAKRFNREDVNIIDHYTYVIHGDGCLMEGISYEACSLAGTLGLGKLILLYDCNSITIEGSTGNNFNEDIHARFSSMHWHVQEVGDGNDIESISEAIALAKIETSKPSIIIVKTIIGFGCESKQGTEKAHGEPLGEANVLSTKNFLQWPSEVSFEVPNEVYDHTNQIMKTQFEIYTKWEATMAQYASNYPDAHQELMKCIHHDFDLELEAASHLANHDGKAVATRVSGGIMLNRFSDIVFNLLGGSADLNPSTKTYLTGKGDFEIDSKAMNVHYGVREHAMGAIANGIAYHGALKPFASTFFVFSDYMKPAIRLAALSHLPVVYIFTHDSIGVGEDGPTHQPIEHLASLRSIPGLVTFRPADTKETFSGYFLAMKEKKFPTALILTRQNLPQLETTSTEACKGGYIVLGNADEPPEIIFMASGSELHIALSAGKTLQGQGIHVRVVSMPSHELFNAQEESYRNKVLPLNVRKRIAIEAGSSMSWHRYVGLDGIVIGLDHFGASAPADTLYKEFGLTEENLLKQAEILLKK